jgi:hypothetical protein
MRKQINFPQPDKYERLALAKLAAAEAKAAGDKTAEDKHLAAAASLTKAKK